MTQSLDEILKELSGHADEPHNGAVYHAMPDDGMVLVKLHALLREEHKFNVGGLVEWKPGLANKSTPYKKPMVVTKVFEKSLLNVKGDAGSPYFREPLDIVCAEVRDGKLYEFYYDSRRLQPYQPEQTT